jgi:hypothetical protein
MRKILTLSLFALLSCAQAAFAHDPRTVAKDFSHTLTVEGAGKLTISYKSLHYNEQVYATTKTNERTLANINRLWHKVGTFNTDFDVVIGGVQVAKGAYDLGISFDAKDNFKLILTSGGKDTTIPLQAATDGPVVGYLSFDMRPSNDTDSFEFEGRYGKIRASAAVKVPYLAPHDHK